ncbi:phage baseplate assembly protein V [Pectobacterium carotovorum]|uniref:phage baseplate assembly protein V n=1 Tax=Pectobacterium carotovorum TaxID=554 RepID=UPI00057C36BF|nr:phage baseplate assembly protein V [Pectobacterium carotovorum]KHT18089.1 baseplate assembly protein [Pectobacterium carotovorum subsp. carotovorum]
MTSNEFDRLLNNLIRIGKVVDVDHVRHLARVETGGNTTDWIRWGVARAGDATSWWPLSVGEQVLIAAPGGDLETAVIVLSLYSGQHRAPSNTPKVHTTVYPDGASETYDANTSTMTVKGVKKVIVEAAESITLDTPKVICTQHLNTQTLSVEKGGTMKGDITHTGGQMSSNGVVVDDHDHGGVQRGGSRTDGPQ